MSYHSIDDKYSSDTRVVVTYSLLGLISLYIFCHAGVLYKNECKLITYLGNLSNKKFLLLASSQFLGLSALSNIPQKVVNILSQYRSPQVLSQGSSSNL